MSDAVFYIGDTDQYLPVTRELIIATKAPDRWFDLDAVRTGEQSKPGGSTNWHPNDGRDDRGYDELGGQPNTGSHPAGAPPLDCWMITDDHPTPPPTPEGDPMSQATFYIGDTRAVMASLPDSSVDLVLTSPPFLALRSYLPSDHPDKALEIGSEPTPAAFIDTLLAVTAEWDRLVAPHGSICIELGDTYSGSGGGGGDYLPGGMRDGQPGFAGSSESQREGNAAHWRAKNTDPDAWPLPKSLTLIPELYRLALVYGINPLTGQPSPAGRWRVRNVVRWHRPNPPVGQLGDKYRPATTDLVIATKATDRWFDLDAVRQPHKPHSAKYDGQRGDGEKKGNPDRMDGGLITAPMHPAGAPPLDTWIIPTSPYKGAHYATWPPQLCVIPIESMCPRHVCNECGQPRRRITESTRRDANGNEVTGDWNAVNYEPGAGYVGDQSAHPRKSGQAVRTDTATLGWSDCGHGDDWRPGVVLDPFAGTGTTLAVASGHARDSIGIDLDPRNADLARSRVGMFLTVEERGSVETH